MAFTVGGVGRQEGDGFGAARNSLTGRENAMSFRKNATSFATTSAFSTVGAFVGIGIFKNNKFARVHKTCKQSGNKGAIFVL